MINNSTTGLEAKSSYTSVEKQKLAAAAPSAKSDAVAVAVPVDKQKPVEAQVPVPEQHVTEIVEDGLNGRLAPPFETGEPIRKYDVCIGFATRDIPAGSYVHSHNVSFREFDRDYAAAHGKEALELLDAKLADADIMIISCARLMRIDFTAAGSLLNWVTARQAEGRQVQFVEVHRLVAAFFNVIGISAQARVSIRRD